MPATRVDARNVGGGASDGGQEKQLLLALLNRYPLIPSAHQPLSKSTASVHQNEANQRLPLIALRTQACLLEGAPSAA